MDKSTTEVKEQVNHPIHYNQYSIEVIDMMISIWGRDETALFCEMNAFKYRMRLGHKDDIQQDLKKEQWYLNKAKEIRLTEGKSYEDDFFTGDEELDNGAIFSNVVSVNEETKPIGVDEKPITWKDIPKEFLDSRFVYDDVLHEEKELPDSFIDFISDTLKAEEIIKKNINKDVEDEIASGIILNEFDEKERDNMLLNAGLMSTVEFKNKYNIKDINNDDDLGKLDSDALNDKIRDNIKTAMRSDNINDVADVTTVNLEQLREIQSQIRANGIDTDILSDGMVAKLERMKEHQIKSQLRGNSIGTDVDNFYVYDGHSLIDFIEKQDKLNSIIGNPPFTPLEININEVSPITDDIRSKVVGVLSKMIESSDDNEYKGIVDILKVDKEGKDIKNDRIDYYSKKLAKFESGELILFFKGIRNILLEQLLITYTALTSGSIEDIVFGNGEIMHLTDKQIYTIYVKYEETMKVNINDYMDIVLFNDSSIESLISEYYQPPIPVDYVDNSKLKLVMGLLESKEKWNEENIKIVDVEIKSDSVYIGRELYVYDGQEIEPIDLFAHGDFYYAYIERLLDRLGEGNDITAPTLNPITSAFSVDIFKADIETSDPINEEDISQDATIQKIDGA